MKPQDPTKEIDRRTLKSGTYKLTREIVNPTPDRRQKYDWRKEASFPAGMEFVVEEHDLGLEADTGYKILANKLKPVREGGGRVLSDYEDLFKTIAAALEPCEESIDAMLARLGVHGCANDRFLRWLLDNELMGRRLFEQLYEAWLNNTGIMGASKLFGGK
jgi:hypothetical protein